MKLENTEKDFFRELATIGGGNAATSLSKILNQNVKLTVPDIYLLDYTQLFSKFGEPDKKTIAVLSEISNEKTGLMMLILDVECTNYLINKFGLKTLDEDTTIIDAFEESAITEISNIIFNSYLNALSMMTKETIKSNMPFLLYDMLGAILNYPINVMPELIDKIVFMDSCLVFNDEKFNASILLISDYDVLKDRMDFFGV